MKGIILGWGSIVAIVFISFAAIIWVNTTTVTDKKVVDKSGDMLLVANTAELVRKMLDPSVSLAAQRASWELGQLGGIEGAVIWDAQSPSINTLNEALKTKLKERMPKGIYELNGIDLEYGSAQMDISGWDSTSCGPATDSKCFFITGFQTYTITDEETGTWDSVEHKFNLTVNSSYFRLLQAGRALMEKEGWLMPAGSVSITGEDFTVNGISGCSGKTAAPQSIANELPIKDVMAFSWRCGWGGLPGVVSMGVWKEAEGKERMARIAEGMGSALGSRHGIEFVITPEVSTVDLGRSFLVRVRSKVNITDRSMWVPLMSGDESATLEGKSYPLARQQLIFSAISEFEMPKPAEFAPG